MGYIKVGNKIISASVLDIIKRLKDECNGRYIKDIIIKGDEVVISCPFHKDGKEQHPSCFVHDNIDDNNHGVFHCFTCGAAGTIIDLVAYCLGVDILIANDWLEERFGDIFLVKEESLQEIELDKENQYLDESILEQYKYFHPYMFKRGLTEDVIRKFLIGCTKDGKYITFPCWDEHNNLVGIYKRSTEKKEFIIPKDIKKCVYLLNFIIKENITKVYVVESQFNALTLWSWGYPAIALFGTGSKEQYEILNKSGIRDYILCFDGDNAGDKGIERFIKNISFESFISKKVLPRGKDVNDLTKEQFDNLQLEIL